MPRRQPVAYLDVRHTDAAFSEHVAASERRRLGIPEQAPPAPKTPPAPTKARVLSDADARADSRGGRTPTPPAPGRPPVSPPSPDRGGRLSAEERGYVNEIVAGDYARRVLP